MNKQELEGYLYLLDVLRHLRLKDILKELK